MATSLPIVIERSTLLDGSAGDVWARVATVDGINHELGPWLRMTVPRAWAGASIADLEPPQRLGRSWVLLFGVVPVDYDDLGIEAVGERSFREVSTMATASRWQHERWIEDEPSSPARSVVRDRLTFTPRRAIRVLPVGAALHARIVSALFAHRHRRLAAWCRACPTRPTVTP